MKSKKHFFPTYVYNTLFVAGLLLLFPAGTVAQQSSEQAAFANLMQAEPVALQNLPNQARSHHEYLAGISDHKKLHVIRLPEKLYTEKKFNLYIHPESREMHFTKGNEATELQLIRKAMNPISDSSYSWIGEIYVPGEFNPIGDATLIQNREGGVTGSITVDGTYFKVLNLRGSSLHVVIEIDYEVRKQRAAARAGMESKGGLPRFSVAPASEPEPKQQTSSESSRSTEATSTATQPSFTSSEPTRLAEGQAAQAPGMMGENCLTDFVRPLVLYTPGAANYGNMNDIISLAVQETNIAYDNSEAYYIEVAPAHIQQLNFNPSGVVDMGDHLEALIANSTVQSLRNQYDADAVILLTEEDYYYPEYGVAGTWLLNSDSAYAIVDVAQASGPDYTFAHELGHLQAAHHHPWDGVPPNLLYSYAQGHRTEGSASKRRSTIMASPYSLGNDYPTIKYFSNPNLSHSGEALGIADYRENYRVLKNTSATVADFRNPNELKTDIFYQESSGSHSFTAQPCGGSGSYSYQWWASQDPTSYGNVESTSSVFSPTLTYGSWWVKLTVTAGSDSASTFITFWVEECDPQDPFCQQKAISKPEEKVESTPVEPELLPAYPNPFNPSTEISFRLPETRAVSLKMYDMAGREVRTLAARRFEAGTHTIRFDAENLSSGQYLLRLQAGDFIRTQTVTLIK